MSPKTSIFRLQKKTSTPGSEGLVARPFGRFLRLLILLMLPFPIDHMGANWIFRQKMSAKNPSAETKETANKTTKKSAKETATNHPTEVVADLALKILQMNRLEIDTTSRLHRQHNWMIPDHLLQRAVVQAEVILDVAAGRTDEDVHAYQLFTPEDGLMSFQDVADRFKDYGWVGLTVRNTVAVIMEDLVTEAEDEVSRQVNKIERAKLMNMGVIKSGHGLILRLRKTIRRSIRCTELYDSLDEPDAVISELDYFFDRYLTNKLLTSSVSIPLEEACDYWHLLSFIDHVCGGLTAVKFSGMPGNFNATIDNLEALCAGLERMKTMDKPSMVAEARELLNLVSHIFPGEQAMEAEFFTELKQYLNKFQKKSVDNAEVDNVRRLVGKSAHHLRAFTNAAHDRAQIHELVLINVFGKLHKFIEKTTSIDQSVRDQIRSLIEPIKHLQWTNSKIKSPPVSDVDGEILRDLGSILPKLEEIFAAFDPKNSTHDEKTCEKIKDMQLLLKKVDKCTKKKPRVAKRKALENLQALLRDVRPYDGTRKCRAYEIFLFAAQQKLIPQKLIKKRSSLKSRPNPPFPYTYKIIMGHGGVNLEDVPELES